MSISAALANAVSGLTAAGRSAQVVSANLANALTPGYGPREIQLSADTIGGRPAGVKVDGVVRREDRALLAERRLSDAEAGDLSRRSQATARLEELFGAADDPGSIAGRVAHLEAQLVSAAARPDSTVRLGASAVAAGDLARALRDASAGVQQLRLDADGAVARDVEALNTGLREVAVLNRKIAALNQQPGEANGLIDQRQQLIDRISGIVPLRVLSRDRDQVALMTNAGQVLLDGAAAEIGFDPAAAMGATTAFSGGSLAGLTVDGEAVSPPPAGRFAGGSLGAAFEIRDSLGPAAQARLDDVARDLLERFEDPAADPTLAPGAPGLFTDDGAAFDATALTGLAARIAVNAAVNPSAGGDPTRLRDGLGAATPADPGDATALNRLVDALSARRSLPSGDLAGPARDAAGFAGQLAALASSDNRLAERDAGFAQARLDTLKERELAGGVDSDQELQKLILIEQAYAANARVIETVDQMVRKLMEI